MPYSWPNTFNRFLRKVVKCFKIVKLKTTLKLSFPILSRFIFGNFTWPDQTIGYILGFVRIIVSQNFNCRRNRSLLFLLFVQRHLWYDLRAKMWELAEIQFISSGMTAEIKCIYWTLISMTQHNWTICFYWNLIEECRFERFDVVSDDFSHLFPTFVPMGN